MGVEGTAVTAAAQDGDDGQLSWVVYLRPARGMQSELEEALKRHAAWHAENAPEHAADDSFSLADAMGQEEVAAAWQELIECVESRQTNFIVARPDLGFEAEE